MLTSTMRNALETTIKRRRNRASQRRWRLIVARSSVPFDPTRLILARVKPTGRQKQFVDDIVGGTGEPGPPRLQRLEEALAAGLVMTATFPVHQLPWSMFPGLPDPELLGLFFRSCHISSNSMTT